MRQIRKSPLLAGLAMLLSPALLLAGPVNVNTADAEAISAELKGIGLAKAQAIVDYRAEHGMFEAPEELLKVKGIGPRVLEKNVANILLQE
jgi:competence protein ComEA